MKSSNEERSPFGIAAIAALLAILANLIVVVQFVGESAALAVVVVLAVWGVGLAYGRRILRWLVRYRRDLAFLALGGVLASAGIGGALLSRTEASTRCPPPPASAPCPDAGSTPTPTPTPPSDPTPDPSGVVYRTPSGEKYHRATCSYVKGKAIRLTLKEAKELGLTPCKVCHPPPLP
jgi:hypothetical protein